MTEISLKPKPKIEHKDTVTNIYPLNLRTITKKTISKTKDRTYTEIHKDAQPILVTPQPKGNSRAKALMLSITLFPLILYLAVCQLI